MMLAQGHSAARASYAPAGAAQRTSYGAGSFSFRSALQAFRTQPIINAAAFAARFNEALAAIVPGVQASASIAVSPGPEVDPSGILNSADRAGPTWWVTVAGSLNASIPWALTGQFGLNRAVARAVAQSMTLGATTPPSLTGAETATTFVQDNPGYRPADGAQLQGVLDNPEACGSYQNTRQMWMRACTTITPISSLPTAPPPTATTTTQGGSVYTAPAQDIGAPSSGSGTLTSGNCAVNIVSQAWIRPTATFDRVGPIAPPGSLLVLLGRTQLTQGSLRLYRVQVAGSPNVNIIGSEGYAALDATDIGTQSPANCSSQIVMQTVAANSSVASTPRPVQVPLAGGTPAGGGTTNPNPNAFPWGTAALAAGVVLLGGAAVINGREISKAVSGGKSRASSSYQKARDAYRSRRRG